jgi:hypothetical protein
MANFSHIPGRGSLAAWSTGSTVQPSEFWFFESTIVKCPNFADGGSYAPTSAINIGGIYGIVLASGTPLTVGGATTLNGLTNNGTTALGNASTDYVYVNGNATSYGTHDFLENVTFAVGKSVEANGNFSALGPNTTIGDSSADACTIDATLSANAPATFADGVNIGSGGAFFVEAAEEHTGTELHSGVSTHEAAIVLDSGAQIPTRTRWLTDSSIVINCTQYDDVVEVGLTDNAKTVELLVTGALEGSTVTIYNRTAATYALGVFESGGFSGSVGALHAMTCVFHSGAWQKKFGFVID